jgi:ribosome-associated heat shock protein Hsp15
VPDVRLDKLLWSLQVFKTRPLATAACRTGRVTIGEFAAKPGRDVHVGEVLVVRGGGLTRTLQVRALPPSRLGAKQLPDFVADLTPAAEYERVKQAGLEQRLARQRSEGRPTKKERRDIDALFESDES